jgi:hypothetical protein
MEDVSSSRLGAGGEVARDSAGLSRKEVEMEGEPAGEAPESGLLPLTGATTSIGADIVESVGQKSETEKSYVVREGRWN